MLPDDPHDVGREYTDTVWSGNKPPSDLDVELARIIALDGALKIDQMDDVHFAQHVLPVIEGLGVRPELTIRRNRSLLGKRYSEVMGTVIATSLSSSSDAVS